MAIDLEAERKRAVRALDNLLLRIQEAERDLEQAQARLEGLFPLRVVWKKIKCGKGKCRCARGVLHGPYPYLIEQKDGKRKERYLGKGWSPPAGMVAPERYQALMRDFREKRERVDRLMDRLYRAVEMMRGW
jgi:hypothetical protein